ncbi:dihydrofolate reductase [Lactobacillus jensenii]|uniref:dihydrofolate reductase n=1 Tax=Lactobacillus jensenii TaxID=109790 RepID=UPI00119372AC|nr:dihydrofolate reductase [Lactobacillus jensenii]MDK7160938.1 dihydrofolate reductase [Lactobacillus jensenii]TVV11859.1 dihydrofolate reductase [Lactobacillus jensenii]TVV14014.1 dihydrofolate reductase [Lactobacillus jensenii]
MISFVWAEDNQHQIGYQGHLPWHLSADLAHFKEKTMGKTMVMGKNTFLSLPFVLPKRKHLVLTHDEALIEKFQNNSQVDFVTSMKQLREYLSAHKEEQIAVIGGVSVFEGLKDIVDCLEKTEIDGIFKADTTMPAIDYSAFKLIKRETFTADENNPYDYSFLTYLRK